jgi:hypothetical protein
MCLVTRTPLALEIRHQDLTNRVKTSFTSVGNSADSPEPLLRPAPATGHDAETLEVYDPDLGYDAQNFPDKAARTGDETHMSRRAIERLWGHISIYSIANRVIISVTPVENLADLIGPV